MDGSKLIAEMAGLSILSLESQHNRLLRIEFPRHDAPAYATLLVNSIKATEELSRDFEFRVDLISDSATIDPASMMAKMVTISMVRSDGSLRHFNGFVTEFQLVRADGGLAYYQMLLEPWLAFTRLTEDCYSFHNRNVIELTEDTFADYLERDWKTRIRGELPTLTCANQYNESDHNHLHRRWEAAGLFYWYEHRADGHTLWLSDDSRMAAKIDEAGDTRGEIRFHAAGGSREDDSIREWRSIRKIKPGKTSLASFDYKNPTSQIATGISMNRQGDVFVREVYHNTGYSFNTSSLGDALAERKMQAIDADALQFMAIGSSRSALPGRTFKLTDHFSSEMVQWDRSMDTQDPAASSEFLIIKATHSASNNYQTGESSRSHYDNELICVRTATQWRPRIGHHSIPHPNPGILTATVVGPEGDEIHTDELGRVRVQFHWDRAGKFDVNSSQWIRVVAPIAGTHFGQSTIPRVNQEVTVHFLAGNVDHPIILGGDYNSNHVPSWRLPSERQLMGFRSREFMSRDGKGGVRSNHLILDDTCGKIQAQIKSDHQCSQLSLGHITRIESTAGRKDFRGEGWELRTDGHGVARAAGGIVITTEERKNARSHIKDISETASRLKNAGTVHEELAEIAQQSDSKDCTQQSKVAAAIQEQIDSIDGGGGERGNEFPQLSKPNLILASPSGIELTTAGSTHIASVQHTALTAEKNISIAAGDSFFASVRKSIRLFAHRAGLKLIASSGDIDLQALSNSINLLSKLDISQTANRITICAKEEIVINGGGSFAKLNASGIETGTDGNYVSHASKHSFVGPKHMKPSTPEVQGIDQNWAGCNHSSSFDLKFLVRDNISSRPLPKVRYKISLASGSTHEGFTDESGLTETVFSDRPEEATIEAPYYGNDNAEADSSNQSGTCCC